MCLFCTTLALVFGLYFLRDNVIVSIVISILYLGFLLFRFGKKKFFIGIALFVIGVALPRIPWPTQESPYRGFVVEARDNYIIYQANLEKYYIYQEDNDFEVGDYLIVNGYGTDLKFTSYESRFNFQDYLHNKGVDKEIKIESYDRAFRSLIRTHAFKKSFLSKFDENAASLIKAFLFNEKDYTSDAIEYANSLGIVYLFSLCGIYLHLLFAILNYIFELKFSKKVSAILTFIVLLPFAFFSITKIGTVRVFLLYLLKYLNDFHFKKKRPHIELVTILALFFIIIDYHLVYQEAFYIGFLLSLLTPLMHNEIKIVPKKKRKFILKIQVLLFMLPLFINNGILIPLSYILIYVFFPINFFFLLISMLSIIIPFYGFVNSVGSGLTWILEKMDLISIKIPFGNWGGYFSIIFYCLFILGLYFLEGVRIRHFRIVGLILSTFLVLSIVPLQEPLTNAVYFINVGQGDSILIKNRTHTIMIDTGGYKSFDMAKECLIPFMNKNKITHIDALITTHDDFDHSGAKDSLMQNFKVYNYLSKPRDFPYKIGDITLENLNNIGGEDDNDKSLVLYTKFMNKKWLFMGDASTKVEKEIISAYPNLHCDILKAGHHGSKTSSCYEFISTIKPEEAIISVGAKNYYGHPNQEVIDILRKCNVKIRQTDLEGTISYLSLLA